MQMRNSSIEFLRFCFMLVIVLWHYGRINPFIHGYIAVDFFFILSGYFIYDSYLRHKADSLTYTIRKVKRLYPEYMLAFIGAFLIKAKIWIHDDVLSTLMNSISELFAIHSVGIYSSGINPPSWYISVLLVGGGIVYSCICINRRISINICFPIIILLSYTYLFGFNGSLELFAVDVFISQPLLRGVAGMSLGTIVAAFYNRSKSFLELHVRLLDILCLVSMSIVFITLFSSFNYDKFALVAFIILILSSLSQGTILNKYFNNKLWTSLGGITYEMLLVHAPIIWVFDYLSCNFFLSRTMVICLAILYVLIVVIASYLLKYIGMGFSNKLLMVRYEKTNKN